MNVEDWFAYRAGLIEEAERILALGLTEERQVRLDEILEEIRAASQVSAPDADREP